MTPGSLLATRRSRAGNAHENTFRAVASTWSKDILLFNIPRSTGKKKTGALYYRDKTGPDFIGSYLSTALAVEVKGATKGRLEFSQITEKQWQDLTSVHRLGGLSYIAAVLRDGRVSMVPWCMILREHAAKKKSVGFAALSEFVTVPGWRP